MNSIFIRLFVFVFIKVEDPYTQKYDVENCSNNLRVFCQYKSAFFQRQSKINLLVHFCIYLIKVFDCFVLHQVIHYFKTEFSKTYISVIWLIYPIIF